MKFPASDKEQNGRSNDLLAQEQYTASILLYRFNGS